MAQPNARLKIAPNTASSHLAHWRLTLIDSWRLSDPDHEVALRFREQRLIALLAVQGGRPRGYVSGVLWPDSTDRHAAGNLRASVWRVDQAAPGLLLHDRSQVRLADDLAVDSERFERCAMRVCGWGDRRQSMTRKDYLDSLSLLLRGELLPGWYEDWVIYERTRLQQLRMHALETLADYFTEQTDLPAARVAASAAVAIEPLRERAQRALIRAQISDGDYDGALRDYFAFRSRLVAEVGVPPSRRLEAIIAPLLERHRITAPRGRERAVGPPRGGVAHR